MARINPFQLLRLVHLAPSPTNPRKHFDEAGLVELANTIEDHGVIEPIIVRTWPDDYDTPADRTDRPLYEIVAGERRYRASMLAKLEDIPALVRHLDTRQVLEIQIIENLQRRGVNELEEAEGYDLMMRDFGYTADQLAEKVGKSRAYIYGRLKLTALCEAVRIRYRAGELDASRALLVARIPVPALQQQAAKEICEAYGGPMSYRTAAQHVQSKYMLDLSKAPFPLEDAFLLISASCCNRCPKRTGNSPELYSDVRADVCTDPKCYADKKANHIARQAELERAAGYKVITGDEARKIAPHGIYGVEVGEYVVLDRESYYGDKMTTARAAIDGHDAQVVMIEDAKTGTLIPVVSKKDVHEALKSKGFRVSTSTRDPRELARERARADEIKFRQALFNAHHESAMCAAAGSEGLTMVDEDMALVARQFWARIGSNAQQRIARLYIVETPERGDDDPEWSSADHLRIRRMTRMIDELPRSKLAPFLLDLALVGTLDVPVPTYIEDMETPTPLLAAMCRAGLDPEQIRETLSGNRTKSAPTPAQAAPARDSQPEKQNAEPAARAKKAAPARDEKPSKPNGKAAIAARKKEKTSGRASASGGEETNIASDAGRCTKTVGMLAGFES